MRLSSIRVRHGYNRDGVNSLLPYDPDDPDIEISSHGWNQRHHKNPVNAAVICMRVWTVFNQYTLYDKYDGAGQDVSIAIKKR